MKYECPECNTRFDEDTLSLNAVCTYRGKWFGDNPEPPEYDWKCPDCGYMGENWYEVSACQECGVDFLDGDTHTCEPIKSHTYLFTCGLCGYTFSAESATECGFCGCDYDLDREPVKKCVDNYDDIPDGLKFMLTAQRMFFDLGAGK